MPQRRGKRKRQKVTKTYNGINKSHYIVKIGNLNVRVGNEPIDNVTGNQGELMVNDNGRALQHYCTINNLKVTNIFFRKRDVNT